MKDYRMITLIVFILLFVIQLVNEMVLYEGNNNFGSFSTKIVMIQTSKAEMY